MPKKPLSQYKINQIVQLSNQGLTDYKVAARLKLSISTVQKYKRTEITIRARMSWHEVSMARELIESGICITEVAGKFEVTELYLKNKIRDLLFSEWSNKYERD